jgi:hypothetical protein
MVNALADFLPDGLIFNLLKSIIGYWCGLKVPIQISYIILAYSLSVFLVGWEGIQNLDF